MLLRLDWVTQLHKIKNVPANFEKNPELTVALSAGGAVIGKTLGSAVAGKAAAGTAGSKILGGKLASPFVAKVCTVVLRTKEASAVYRSKMAFFKRAWQKVKVMSRP